MTKSLREKLIDYGVAFSISCLCGAVLILVIMSALGPDPDRARFMLDCVSDFQYTAKTCQAIWEGADPPPVPDGMEPGC